MAQAQGRQLYTGTFTIDSNHTLMDIPVSLPNDPEFVIVVPNFTPTYGVNSTIMYYAVKSLVKVSTNATVEENNYIMPLGVEGRSNVSSSGYALAYTGYTSVINNIILSKARIYLPTRTSGYPWQDGEYTWYAG